MSARGWVDDAGQLHPGFEGGLFQSYLGQPAK
jgi:hypothetical protein